MQSSSVETTFEFEPVTTAALSNMWLNYWYLYKLKYVAYLKRFWLVFIFLNTLLMVYIFYFVDRLASQAVEWTQPGLLVQLCWQWTLRTTGWVTSDNYGVSVTSSAEPIRTLSPMSPFRLDPFMHTYTDMNHSQGCKNALMSHGALIWSSDALILVYENGL